MGNTSSLRRALLKDDVNELERILQEAGEGSPDLINEDYTSDCLCNRFDLNRKYFVSPIELHVVWVSPLNHWLS